jgi:hypothetical protein
MLSKKDLLKKCDDLQIRIGYLQDQINVIRSEQFTTVEVVDSTGKPVMIPGGWVDSTTRTGQAWFNSVPYPKTQCLNVKEVVEAILNHLNLNIKTVDQVPAKAIVTKKGK